MKEALINQIIERVGNLEEVLITDEHIKQLQLILNDCIPDDSLKAAVEEEIEYMFDDGIMYYYFKDDEVEIVEKIWSENKSEILEDTANTVNVHDSVIEWFRNYMKAA